MGVRHDHVEAVLEDRDERVSRGAPGGAGGSSAWVRGADLVVHDGAQAHNAHMDVVFLADQPGVLQSSPAWQRVTTTEDGKKVKESTGV